MLTGALKPECGRMMGPPIAIFGGPEPTCSHQIVVKGFRRLGQALGDQRLVPSCLEVVHGRTLAVMRGAEHLLVAAQSQLIQSPRQRRRGLSGSGYAIAASASLGSEATI